MGDSGSSVQQAGRNVDVRLRQQFGPDLGGISVFSGDDALRECGEPFAAKS